MDWEYSMLKNSLYSHQLVIMHVRLKCAYAIDYSTVYMVWYLHHDDTMDYKLKREHHTYSRDSNLG